MRRVGVLLASLFLLLLVGCFKNPNGAISQGPAVSIELSPASITLNPGELLNITAVVYDQSRQGVTWTATPVNLGTLTSPTSSSVNYTAPSSLGTPTTITVTATSVTNPNVSASAKITVTPVIALYVVNFVTGQNFYSSQNINQGDQLVISASPPNGNFTNFAVQWSMSPSSGEGSLSGPNNTSVTYVAPGTVASPTTVTVTAQIPGTSASGSLQVTVYPSGAAANVAAVSVNGGPVPGQVYPNAAFTSVTLCNPGSSICQTVSGILVDTGSSGLRILQSEIPFLSLRSLVDGNGNTLHNCDLQVDGSYLWGPVLAADVYVSGELAPSLPIQVINSANAVVPGSCSNGGITNENTPQLLGANGILGIGPEPTDCTTGGVNYCDGSTQAAAPPNLYYTCPSVGCTTSTSAIFVDSVQQVANPIPFFGVSGGTDSNGVVLQFPSVDGTEASVTGSMTFGIGSETNNGVGSATIFTLDSNDHFTTAFAGQTLTSSFIDSGSNGLFFPDSLPVCTVNTQYFCPSSLTSLSATNTGATQGQEVVNFSVDNADSLLANDPSNATFSALAGPDGTFDTCSAGMGSCTFEWGMPFYYGRTVYLLIDGQPSPTGLPSGPWVAY